jgi:SP family general alpha glucoside:H+ symporter-like MFS transporter
MEGYDTGLLGSFYGLEQFRRAYGSQLPDGDWQVAPAMQALTGSLSSLGSIFGLFFAGWITNRVGYRWTMLLGLLIISGGIFITFFAKNITMILIGQIVCGFPWGMFQGITSSYAADIAPLRLRPILTSYINLCWAIGQFMSNGVLRAMLTRDDQWAYRIPFAVQWVWPIPIAIFVLLAPESPWWLIRNGKKDRARKVLRSLARRAHQRRHRQQHF